MPKKRMNRGRVTAAKRSATGRSRSASAPGRKKRAPVRKISKISKR